MNNETLAVLREVRDAAPALQDEWREDLEFVHSRRVRLDDGGSEVEEL